MIQLSTTTDNLLSITESQYISEQVQITAATKMMLSDDKDRQFFSLELLLLLAALSQGREQGRQLSDNLTLKLMLIIVRLTPSYKYVDTHSRLMLDYVIYRAQ